MRYNYEGGLLQARVEPHSHARCEPTHSGAVHLGLDWPVTRTKQPLRNNPALLGDGEDFNVLPLTSEVRGAKPGVNGR